MVLKAFDTRVGRPGHGSCLFQTSLLCYAITYTQATQISFMTPGFPAYYAP